MRCLNVANIPISKAIINQSINQGILEWPKWHCYCKVQRLNCRRGLCAEPPNWLLCWVIGGKVNPQLYRLWQKLSPRNAFCALRHIPTSTSAGVSPRTALRAPELVGRLVPLPNYHTPASAFRATGFSRSTLVVSTSPANFRQLKHRT